MVRRGDNQGVEVLLFLVKHLAGILIDPGARKGLEDWRGELVVEVAQSHDLFVLAAIQVILAHSADAHGGDGQFVARRLIIRAAQDMTGNNQGRQAGGNRRTPGKPLFR